MTSRWSLPEDESPAVAAPAAPSTLLKEPLLYIGGISEAVSDAQIVEALWECLKVRPRIERVGDPSAPAKGHIEFESLERAEKAYATVNGQAFSEFSSALTLHTSPHLPDDPAPSAVPRLFKSLPLNTTAGSLFDLCRPFGPVHRVALQLAEGPRRGSGAAAVFKGQALVTFYDEEHAKFATDELHCSELHGNTIIVQNFVPARARKSDVGAAAASPQASPSRWAAAAAITPGELALGHGQPPLNAIAAPFTPPQQRSFSTTSQVSIHAGGSPTSPRISQNGHGSHLPSAQSAIPIDPSNLFVKSLDPSITSQDLFFLFKNFGRIISAKVMTDAEGRSKEFGFVSYEQPEQAAAALQAMDGQPAGPSGRIITVRFHEPKKFREGKAREASSADGMSELDHGIQSLSTTATPDFSPNSNTYSPNPNTSRRASSTFESSPAPAASSPGTSPSSSPVALPQSEHDRLVSNVQRIEPTQFGEVVQLLEGLPKKERAMCLFNPEYLKQKVADALLVLSTSDDDDETPAPAPAPSAPISADPAPLPSSTTTPSHPAEPLPASLAELAALPAVTIIALESQLGSLGVGKVEEEKKSEMDSFMDGLEGKPPHEVKQKLGERLFKAIKATGIKGAPRITIALLDTEELRPLAHLINLPEVLKEKVLRAAASPTK